jgi:hypothetical protein
MSRPMGFSSERTSITLRKIVTALNVISVITAGWTIFYPHPYVLAAATAAVLPIIALGLVIARPGQLETGGARNDRRPQIVTSLMLPGLALCFRTTLRDAHLIRYAPALVAGAVGGIVFATGMIASDPKLREGRWKLLLLLPLLSVHPYAVAVEANWVLDRSQPRAYEAQVLDSWISRGKHTSYRLRLGRWGPRMEPDDVTVSRATYRTAKLGSRIWVRMNDGALGMPWFVVLPASPGP